MVHPGKGLPPSFKLTRSASAPLDISSVAQPPSSTSESDGSPLLSELSPPSAFTQPFGWAKHTNEGAHDTSSYFGLVTPGYQATKAAVMGVQSGKLEGLRRAFSLPTTGKPVAGDHKPLQVPLRRRTSSGEPPSSTTPAGSQVRPDEDGHSTISARQGTSSAETPSSATPAWRQFTTPAGEQVYTEIQKAWNKILDESNHRVTTRERLGISGKRIGRWALGGISFGGSALIRAANGNSNVQFSKGERAMAAAGGVFLGGYAGFIAGGFAVASHGASLVAAPAIGAAIGLARSSRKKDQKVYDKRVARDAVKDLADTLKKNDQLFQVETDLSKYKTKETYKGTEALSNDPSIDHNLREFIKLVEDNPATKGQIAPRHLAPLRALLGRSKNERPQPFTRTKFLFGPLTVEKRRP